MAAMNHHNQLVNKRRIIEELEKDNKLQQNNELKQATRLG